MVRFDLRGNNHVIIIIITLVELQLPLLLLVFATSQKAMVLSSGPVTTRRLL